jgi:hypothetical protein
MIHELKQLFQVETPLGPGWAIFLETTSHDYYWTVALETGALVCFTQDQIRIAESYTHRRGISHVRMRKIVQRKDKCGSKGRSPKRQK